MEDIHLRTSGRAPLSVSVARAPETGLMCIQINGFLLFVFSLIKLIGMNGNGDVFSTYQKFSLLVSWKTFAVCSSNSSWLKMGCLIITLVMRVAVFPHMRLLTSLEIKSMLHPLIWKSSLQKEFPSNKWWNGWADRGKLAQGDEQRAGRGGRELGSFRGLSPGDCVTPLSWFSPARLSRNAELWWS